MSRDAALQIVRTLTDAGHTAYFAGGCVRDALLGLEPSDYDVATDAEPGRVRSLFRNTQAVGEHFGVVLVRLAGAQVEVATFRTDGDYHDGRRPEDVTFSTPEADARRRDFTINGLFHDPLKDTVIDFVGGRADLDAGVLRAIGEPAARFAEDHLRLLRAVRFAARFDLSVDPATAEAVRTHAASLTRVTPERVGHEVRKMLEHSNRGRAGDLLAELNLLPVLTRPLAVAGKAAGGGGGGDRLAHLDLPRAMPALAALLLDRLDRTPDLAATMRRTLRLGNRETDELATCLAAPAMLAGAVTVAQRRRFLARPFGASALAVLKASVAAGAVPPAALAPMLADAAKPIGPPPLVTGADLIELGLTPGPRFKKLLDRLYDDQLEGELTTRDDAIAAARRAAGRAART